MTISFVASALGNDGITASQNSVPFVVPAGASVGDVALCAIVHNVTTDVTCTPPAGWTLLEDAIVSGSGTISWLFAKVLVSGDPGATRTFTIANGRNVGVMDVFTGADAIAPWEADASLSYPSFGTSQVGPAITALTANALIWNAWTASWAGPGASTITAPGSHTALGFASANFAAGASPSCRTAQRTALASAPGSFGGYTATFNQSIRGAGFAVSLKPLGAIPPSAGDLIIDRS